MSTAREPCPNCRLPFYTDRYSECPYCGASASTDEPAAGRADPSRESVDTSPADSVARETPPSRPRTTCSRCGLPHYADDDTGCPYCARAGVVQTTESAGTAATDDTATAGATAGATGEGPTAGATTTAGTASRDEEGGGFLARLRGLFGR